jgi:plastocyanin
MLLTALLVLAQNGTLGGTVALPPPPKSKLTVKYAGQTGASAKREPAPSPAVVWLEGVKGDFKPPAAAVAIEQEGIEFRPRVLPVLVGTTVEFPNKDNVYHNVFSLSKSKKFDLGRYATGESKGVAFDAPGEVRVYCEIHEHMKAFVIAVDNPFFTTTDAEGRWALKDVPPGTYTLAAWHESAKPVRAPVTVTPGETRQDVKFGAAAPGAQEASIALGSCCAGK